MLWSASIVDNVHRGADTISQDLLFWLALALKLVLTAGIVVTASVVVERAGPLIGALVVTLPVTVWPAYVFLSLDHDAAYLAAAAGAGLSFNAVSSIFMLLYLVLAQRRGLVVSLGAAVVSWIALAWLVRSSNWTLYSALLLNLLLFSFCLVLSRRYREVKAPQAPSLAVVPRPVPGSAPAAASAAAHRLERHIDSMRPRQHA